jgi:hypothetical protein
MVRLSTDSPSGHGAYCLDLAFAGSVLFFSSLLGHSIEATPGFFIAALAAISALRNRSLDRSLEGDAPKLERRVRGRPIIVELNIRQFLLFSAAYTSALSLCLLIVATTFSYAFSESAVLSYVGSELFFYVAGTILFLFLYFCSSLIVTTAHMIYFLSEGAHLPV